MSAVVYANLCPGGPLREYGMAQPVDPRILWPFCWQGRVIPRDEASGGCSAVIQIEFVMGSNVLVNENITAACRPHVQSTPMDLIARWQKVNLTATQSSRVMFSRNGLLAKMAVFFFYESANWFCPC